MPAFVASSAGSAVADRDARGEHSLVFGAAEQGEALHALAPGIFTGGGGAPIQSAYGQFVSVILDSVARVPAAGGAASGKTFGLYRCSDTFIARCWTTVLAVVSRMDEPARLKFWAAAQRDEFLAGLRRYLPCRRHVRRGRSVQLARR